jgi:hypothetical protein
VDVLTAPHGKPDDGFGSSVAVSGTTALAGTPFLTVGSNADSGVVYVFTSGSTISPSGGAG